VLEVMIFLI